MLNDGNLTVAKIITSMGWASALCPMNLWNILLDFSGISFGFRLQALGKILEYQALQFDSLVGLLPYLQIYKLRPAFVRIYLK
jgi:hypothetical protein